MTNQKLKSKKIKIFLKDYGGKLLLLLLLLVGIWFICYRIKITPSTEHLFWTFSTVMQSFVALGAILGMVVVFRLQGINSEIENLIPRPRKRMQYWGGTAKDVLREGKKYLKDVPELRPEMQYLEELLDDRVCVHNCGIVKVEVNLVEVVQERK